MKKAILITILALLLGAGGTGAYFAMNYNADPCSEGHTPVVVEGTPATCTQSGVSESSYCSVCDALITKKTILPPTAHTSGEWITDLEPTCTTQGLHHKSCTVCGAITESEPIAVTAHEYGEWQGLIAPTCQHAGEKSRTCTHCGNEEKQTLTPLAHALQDNAWVIDSSPSCERQGVRHQNCPDCGTTVLEKIAALGHSFTTTVNVAPTCTTPGMTGKACSRCSQSNTQPVPATGHSAGAWETGVAATDTEDGIRYQYCGNGECGTRLSFQILPATNTAVGLTYTINADGKTCTVTAIGQCNKTALVIPRSITDNGTTYTVTAIGEGAFTNNTTLTSVTIPPTVTRVGANAFSGCTGLLQTHAGVHYAGNWAVGADRDITTLSLRAGTLGIADLAFFGCTSLTTAAVGAHIAYIGQNPFAYCPALSTLSVDAGHASYRSPSSSCILRIEDGTLISACAGTPIPSDGSVTALGDFAFFGTGIKNAITVPACIKKIGKGVFGGCNLLTAISVDSGNTVYRSEGNCIIERASNTLVAGIKTASIPSSVTAIADNAFCGMLFTSITIPASVTRIGANVFAGCSKLVQITNLSTCTLTNLPANAGLETRRSTSAAFTNTLTQLSSGIVTFTVGSKVYLIDYVGTSAALTLTDTGVTALYPYALYTATITKLTCPVTVTSFGKACLENCTKLSDVTISVDGISALNKQSITRLTLYVTSASKTVPANAFRDCRSLQYLSLPSDCIVGAGAFAGCTGLREINVPASAIGAIPKNSITAVTINAGTAIPASAFSGCVGLTTLTVPASVTFVGKNAFADCSNLQTATVPPAALSEMVKTKIKTLTIAGVGSISSNCFKGLTALQTLTIGAGVTTIGSYGFSECTGLTSVTIGTDVTAIEQYAFYKCTKLQTVTFEKGSSLTSLGYTSVFRGCTALHTVVLPDSLTSLGVYMFAGCTALRTVWLPVTLTSIKNYAFNSCSSLTTVYYAGTATQWEGVDVSSTGNSALTTNKLVYNRSYY